jgi:hypothetical protein
MKVLGLQVHWHNGSGRGAAGRDHPSRIIPTFSDYGDTCTRLDALPRARFCPRSRQNLTVDDSGTVAVGIAGYQRVPTITMLPANSTLRFEQ